MRVAKPGVKRCAVAGAACLAVAVVISGTAAQQGLGYDNTPFLPDSPWRVHDGTRPQPPVVTPPPASPAPPPADAVVLFDGTGLAGWTKLSGEPAEWLVENGEMVVVARAGHIMTTEVFGDVQLHLEWATPAEVSGDGQGRGNSGVFLMGRYEIQVLDSFENPTYPDGQAGAIYGQTPPMVNASRGPGQWQSYDIVFTAPRFEGDTLVQPAVVTVFHNGVLVHNAQPFIGRTAHRAVATYAPGPDKAPLALQDHGNPMRFRNIWVRPL